MSNSNTEPRILFILKDRSYGFVQYAGENKSSGLYNSAKFVVDMLIENNFNVKMVDVEDNNSIDREVSIYKPTHVILEALWCTPLKVGELTKLHPSVEWVIRCHSETAFIANEGIAMNWIHEYVKYPNVSIATNSKRFKTDLETLLPGHDIGYMPNYYDIDSVLAEKADTTGPLYILTDGLTVEESDDIINVCCFGAIRPLKNQLQQAISAIQFAENIGKILHFHINGTRVENNGDPTIKNIRQLFEQKEKHRLVEHLWSPHANFLDTLKLMDIGMQVSFTETYNIVAADMIAADIPVVTSPEVMFVSKLFHADPTDTKDIANKLQLAWALRKINAHRLNRHKLQKDANRAELAWIKYFR